MCLRDSGKEMKELKDSMDTIRLTAADFLEKLEAAVAERSAERMTEMCIRDRDKPGQTSLRPAVRRGGG